MQEHNAELVRRAVEEIWNQGDLTLADVLFAPSYVNHGGLIPDLVCGPGPPMRPSRRRATVRRQKPSRRSMRPAPESKGPSLRAPAPSGSVVRATSASSRRTCSMS